MVLEDIFRRPSIPVRLRTPPLGSLFDGFCEWLCSQGYSGITLFRRIWQVSHFNHFLHQAGVNNCRKIERSFAARFLTNHLPRCRCKNQPWKGREGTPGAVRSIMAYLDVRGLLAPPAEEPSGGSVLQGEFLGYLRSERNLGDSSIQKHRQFLVPFLKALGPLATRKGLRRLSPREVHRFFLKHSEKAGPGTRRDVQGFLRIFLRFCLQRGYVKRDLSQAVPKIRRYRLSQVPRGLAEEEIRKILGGIRCVTPVGRRDFSILQILANYGVRGGQVRALKLGDIQWRQERIRFPGQKGGKEVVAPLIREVGESLVDYLRHGRPRSAHSQVFLTTFPPFRPLCPSAVSVLVHARMRRAGVSGRPMGSHTFRHAFASRLLRQGQSIKTIADLLGHRNINTTFIYTKVDFATLRQLPLDWPEVGT